MTKIRIAYGVAMVMTAAAFLWNGVYFALDVFLFQLALFLILKILLRLEMARLKFSVSLPAACACGQSVKLHISASNFFVLAAAIMEGDRHLWSQQRSAPCPGLPPDHRLSKADHHQFFLPHYSPGTDGRRSTERQPERQ